MKIKSKIKEYSVTLVEDSLKKRAELFRGFKGRLFYFVDEEFYRLYKKSLQGFTGKDFCLPIKAVETNKSYQALGAYYEALIESGFTRQDCLVTFGGGILQDISGFIACSLYRGVPWVYFPTTLLAQADSCIGSKTSINFKDSKNLIGTFFPPDQIYIDVGFCETLSDEYFNSGLGEIIKFHLLSDEKHYATLKKYLASPNLRTSPYFKEIILSTLEVKKSYFEEDEFDTGRRNLLNYGHCFGHALESASGFTVCHGEAVIVGMGFANLMSLRRGILSAARYEEFENILKRFYPRFDLSRIAAEDLIHYLKRDKKRVGTDLTMILTKDLGDHVKLHDIKEEEFHAIYKEFSSHYQATVSV